MFLTHAVSLLSVAFMATQVVGHTYISKVSADGGGWQGAQKKGHKEFFREAPDNTGWVGSKFIGDNKAIVCSASNTPFKTVAAPGGRFFSDPSESAAKSLDVKAGGKVTVVTSGNPGQGFPHPNGHVQVYLAFCGDGHDACNGFDASKGDWFKIVGEKNGIQNTLRKHLRGDLDGQTYDIAIPKTIKSGSYILRFELIAFGQSSSAEGQQDQYYPLCGHITVNGGAGTQPNFKVVKFPGAYKSGNIDQNTLPGPGVMELVAGGTTPTPSDPPATPTPSDPPADSNTGGNDGGNGTCTPSAPVNSNAPECATMCFGVKITEAGHLAPSCGANDITCMCRATKFKQAFDNCAKDHCGGQLFAAKDSFDSLCVNTNRMVKRVAKRAGKRGHLARRDRSLRSTFALRDL
ncbi:hypothetical protein EXIGLDRAFT_665838 [Exidia glandulosa HHB12029]|uniref:lytic cellulose monooxygenase (C4-dehydrogenating) n=1 Tax=Exidia glandulosa HHB12029 TaxID=1314781 RepID=A0A166BL13_EXIGL|nr:hypothetical protein EXIGLDRAFT_665838 [Exidia glandulosa HHB12029]